MSYREIFDFFPDFVTKFEIEGRSYGGNRDPRQDTRLPILAERFSPTGKRVLELGPLEAGHTLLLHEMKAREVVSLEGRVTNYLRCCAIKNIYNLSNCKFYLEDFRSADLTAYGKFDLCLCMGVLYHVPKPHDLLRRIRQVADTVWIWTHYADEASPEGPIQSLECEDPVTHTVERYHGKNYQEITSECQAGLQPDSFWPLLDDLVRMVQQTGFTHCDVLNKAAVDKFMCCTIFATSKGMNKPK